MDERAEQQLLGVVDRAAMRTCIVDRTFISLTTDGSVTTRCIRGAPRVLTTRHRRSNPGNVYPAAEAIDRVSTDAPRGHTTGHVTKGHFALVAPDFVRRGLISRLQPRAVDAIHA